jgi:hypothetical protein
MPPAASSTGRLAGGLEHLGREAQTLDLVEGLILLLDVHGHVRIDLDERPEVGCPELPDTVPSSAKAQNVLELGGR